MRPALPMNPRDARLALERVAHPRAVARLSACARGDQTAGPRLRLSSLNWMPVASIARPIKPPSASISRTRCPFAVPPIAGLHGMCATVSIDSVQIADVAPHARRRPRRFHAGVARADDDDVECVTALVT